MPFNIFKVCFLGKQCSSKKKQGQQFKHKNKQKLCRIFVVPGNEPAPLGIPDIKLLDIVDINCNTKRGELSNKTFQLAESRKGVLHKQNLKS